MKHEIYKGDDGLKRGRAVLDFDDLAQSIGIFTRGAPGDLAALAGARHGWRLCFLFGCGWPNASDEYVHRCLGEGDPGCLDAPVLMPAGSMKSNESAGELPLLMTECARDPEAYLAEMQEEWEKSLIGWTPVFGLKAAPQEPATAP